MYYTLSLEINLVLLIRASVAFFMTPWNDLLSSFKEPTPVLELSLIWNNKFILTNVHPGSLPVSSHSSSPGNALLFGNPPPTPLIENQSSQSSHKNNTSKDSSLDFNQTNIDRPDLLTSTDPPVSGWTRPLLPFYVSLGKLFSECIDVLLTIIFA